MVYFEEQNDRAEDKDLDYQILHKKMNAACQVPVVSSQRLMATTG